MGKIFIRLCTSDKFGYGELFFVYSFVGVSLKFFLHTAFFVPPPTLYTRQCRKGIENIKMALSVLNFCIKKMWSPTFQNLFIFNPKMNTEIYRQTWITQTSNYAQCEGALYYVIPNLNYTVVDEIQGDCGVKPNYGTLSPFMFWFSGVLTLVVGIFGLLGNIISVIVLLQR